MKNYEEIKNYLLNHIDVIGEIVSEINSIDGSLEFLEYWNNDEEFLTLIFIIILWRLLGVHFMDTIITVINMLNLTVIEI